MINLGYLWPKAELEHYGSNEGEVENVPILLWGKLVYEADRGAVQEYLGWDFPFEGPWDDDGSDG